MQTSLSHNTDEAQTSTNEVSQRDIATVKTLAVLTAIADASHLVCHAILDEGSKVTTLDEAKEGLQHLLDAIHAGSDAIQGFVGEYEMSLKTNASAPSSLN